MNMKRHLYSAVFLLLVGAALPAESGDDHIEYDIPSGAIKVGPRPTRDLRVHECRYFAPGSDATAENLVAVELEAKGVIVKRELFRAGKKHGVQREWHPNGALKMEMPYRDGIMEGTVKLWDSSGALVSQYVMAEGSGTAVVYDSDGRVVKEEHFKDNQRDGFCMEHLRTKVDFTRWQNGRLIGNGYDFHVSGEVAAVAFFSEKGDPVALIEFSAAGNVTQKFWYVEGREVSESDYAAAAAKDPSLPRYYADANEYKKLAEKEARRLFEQYRSKPRVKIPLQWDEKGDLVPALP